MTEVGAKSQVTLEVKVIMQNDKDFMQAILLHL
jgi:hypothetical protein